MAACGVSSAWRAFFPYLISNSRSNKLFDDFSSVPRSKSSVSRIRSMLTLTASTKPTPSSGSGTPPSSVARSFHKLSTGPSPPPLSFGLLLLAFFLSGVHLAFFTFVLAGSASVLWSAACAAEVGALPPAVRPRPASDPASSVSELQLAWRFCRRTPLRVRDPPWTRKVPENVCVLRNALIVIVCGCPVTSSASPALTDTATHHRANAPPLLLASCSPRPPTSRQRWRLRAGGRSAIPVPLSEDTESKPFAIPRSDKMPDTFSSDLTAILAAYPSETRASQSPASPPCFLALARPIRCQPARSQNRPWPPTFPIPAHQNHGSTQNHPSPDSARAVV